MHPATTSPPPPRQTLDQIIHLISSLLTSTLHITSFTSRWQILRTKLASLKRLISEISDSPHWSENPVLLPILPALLATLVRIETLCHYCSDSEAFCKGKLLMQSDLDMATGWLSKQINDLDLLLRSGVLHQSTAIVLSRPNAGSSKEELSFFVKDLFTRLQIGGVEFKRKGLDSLIQLLSDDEKSAGVVAKEGNIGCLVSFLDQNHSQDGVRELAISAVALLVSAGDSPCKCVFEEGALGPLLRTIECSPMSMKEKAVMAVECITADPDNAWAISAYGGVPILLELCKSGSIVAQSYAVGAIRNVCSVEDIRTAMVEEGAIPVLMQLLISGSASAQGKAANCMSILASSSEEFRNLLLQDKALHSLLHLFHECKNLETLEHVLRAIYSLSASDMGYRFLSGSTSFIVRIAEHVKNGNVMLQHICASLLANLSMSDNDKKTISGCMGSLVKLMEAFKPDGMQEVGAKALISLLSVKSNRKELVRDEKSLMKLMKMLDPKNEVAGKKFPVAVVAAVMVGGSQSCRKKLMAAGACGYLQRLAELDISGAKKALQRLSGNRLTNIFNRTFRD